LQFSPDRELPVPFFNTLLKRRLNKNSIAATRRGF
jgi:hypothetical protein